MIMEDALTAMDMLGHDFFIFKELHTGKVNVAYLRNDGKYGVIETE
jgi:putative sigma-54 modulation protein